MNIFFRKIIKKKKTFFYKLQIKKMLLCQHKQDKYSNLINNKLKIAKIGMVNLHLHILNEIYN
jgi:hypothetical protein